MIIEQKTLSNQATITTWEITETVDQLLSTINFNPFVIEQISNFGSEKRKLEYLAIRAILYTTYKKDVSIEYKPNRMPYLSDHSAQISITHTGKYASLIIHPTNPVGIDIERQSDRVARVKHKFLSAEELANIDPNTEKTQLAILWAAKEALYKVIGVELVDFTKQIIIAPFQAYQQGTITAHETCSPDQANYTLEYQVNPEYTMVWVVANDK